MLHYSSNQDPLKQGPLNTYKQKNTTVLAVQKDIISVILCLPDDGSRKYVIWAAPIGGILLLIVIVAVAIIALYYCQRRKRDPSQSQRSQLHHHYIIIISLHWKTKVVML